MRCEQHGHPLVHIEGTVNGDPWVCAECAYRTALAAAQEAAREKRRGDELQAILTVVCDISNKERERYAR